MFNNFPFYRQLDSRDCGPTCLKMVAKFFGKNYSLEYLRQLCHLSKQGSSLQNISEAAEAVGFRTMAVKISFSALAEDFPLPAILHWNQNHYVILLPQKIKKNSKSIEIADPANNIRSIDKESFLKSWVLDNGNGIALILEPTTTFYESEEIIEAKSGFSFLFKYLRPYKHFIIQIFLSLLAGSILSLFFPLLMQALIDKGVKYKNLNFINLVLISQLILFLGVFMMELLRNWIFLHLNSRINITIIADFLAKIMRLPINFFDSRNIGDIKQRIVDHQRVQNFLTGTAITTIFSTLNFLIYTIVLSFYSRSILLVFVLLSTSSVIWIVFFLKRRKKLDYLRFEKYAQNEALIYELVTGMPEIKINNAEIHKRWDWERLQVKLFRLNISGLKLSQSQLVGSTFFNQIKNILVTFIAANEVVGGRMSLGMMMSVSFIVGQLNSPIEQLLTFIQTAQDTKISLDRIAEIHSIKDEDLDEGIETDSDKPKLIQTKKIIESISLQNVSFQYDGPKSPYALKNINLVIGAGQVTAIVGASGSGKSTLLKLLLKYYKATDGKVCIGETDINYLSSRWWRGECGVVLQDGYIFSDTISKNISLGNDGLDNDRIRESAEIANINSFIEELPMRYETRIGNAGLGLSVGQKQRILIARAVHNNPNYLLFDEATSSLDANNEMEIVTKLSKFYMNKTVVIIAHRLSTVKNADQIVVLEKGEIVEIGTHKDLSEKKGYYYNLVKNQLELGA